MKRGEGGELPPVSSSSMNAGCVKRQMWGSFVVRSIISEQAKHLKRRELQQTRILERFLKD